MKRYPAPGPSVADTPRTSRLPSADSSQRRLNRDLIGTIGLRPECGPISPTNSCNSRATDPRDSGQHFPAARSSRIRWVSSALLGLPTGGRTRKRVSDGFSTLTSMPHLDSDVEAVHYTVGKSGGSPLNHAAETNSGKPESGIGTEWNRSRASRSCKLLKTWWPGTELNRRRQPFQGSTLPSLSG